MPILCAVVFMSGCGTNYDADTNTVYVKSNGKIIETSMESFSDAEISEDELKQFISDEIDAYCEENDTSIKEKNFTYENGEAKITLEYDNASDYAGFHKKDFFAGTVVQALAAGYSIPVEFDSEDNVVIVEENVTVNVKGTIQSVSDNVSILDEGSAAVTGYGDDAQVSGNSYIVYN